VGFLRGEGGCPWAVSAPAAAEAVPLRAAGRGRREDVIARCACRRERLAEARRAPGRWGRPSREPKLEKP
jgi:hypothetical protein